MNQAEFQSWKMKVLIIGAVAGAAVGFAAAYLLANQAEQQGKTPQISAGEGVRVGIMVMGLLRSIAGLAEG